MRNGTTLRALVTVGCLALALTSCSKDTPPQPAAPPATVPTSATPAKPTPAAPATPKPPNTDPLTGGKKSGNEVFAVKIENTAAARPQVGLGRADIVVVEEVEAKITRMIGIFHTDFPGRVGPVRSARNTDAELLPLFGKPGLIYSGANRKVQDNLRNASLVPIERSDRDHSRPAPHNVMVNLGQLAKSHKVGTGQPIGWTFAASDARWKAAAGSAGPKVKVGGDTTSFSYSGGRYSVAWNGSKNVDGDNGKAVKTDNVIVLSVRNHHDSDSTSNISVVSETVGKGAVTIYRDGKKLTGSWTREKVSAPMRFVDGSGKDLPLKPGQSWLLLQGR